jgi:hypothetical protein
MFSHLVIGIFIKGTFLVILVINIIFIFYLALDLAIGFIIILMRVIVTLLAVIENI